MKEDVLCLPVGFVSITDRPLKADYSYVHKINSTPHRNDRRRNGCFWKRTNHC